MIISAETTLVTSYASGLLLAAGALDRRAQCGANRIPRFGSHLQGGAGTWPHSEAARFRRGLALLLVGLATLQLVVTAVRHPHLPDLAATTASLAAAALLGYRVCHRFRRSPTGHPVTTATSDREIRMQDTERSRPP